MEPIRPERDEVVERKGAKPKPQGKTKPKADTGARSSGGGSGFTVIGLFVLLLVAAGAGGWLIYQQMQEVERLESELGDAQEWINQSKLSLARFEGQLTETDQELAQSGDKVGDKLAFLESEIRKLWGVSYDRNRKAIKSNEEGVEALKNRVGQNDKSLETLTTRLDEQAEKLKGVDQTASRVAELGKQLNGLETKVESRLGELDKQMSRQMQQQKLAMDEIRARLSSVERKLREQDSQAQVAALKKDLDELENVVKSIDAFRSQITSRLLQLESQVESQKAGNP